MPGDYLEKALYGAYIGTPTVDGPPLSDTQGARGAYMWLDEKVRAHLCVECGECLEKWPQHIEIPDWLVKADALQSATGGT